MKLIIIGRNIFLKPKIRFVVYKKLGDDLEHFLQGVNPLLKKAIIRIKKRKGWGYEMNFSMWLPGKKHIFAEENGETIFFTLTSLKDKIQREIKKITSQLELCLA